MPPFLKQEITHKLLWWPAALRAEISRVKTEEPRGHRGSSTHTAFQSERNDVVWSEIECVKP